MHALSFAIPLEKVTFAFVNPDDTSSVTRGVRGIMDTLEERAQAKGFSMQCRKNTRWNVMAGVSRLFVSLSTVRLP